MRAGAKCPICEAAVGPRVAADGKAGGGNAAFPFCSERCRLIDLGQWLGENYRLPAEDVTPGDDVNLEDGEPRKK